MKQPGEAALSIVIPNYNHGKYLAQTIESVLDQTSEAFEVVVSDNHSSDSSAEIARGYGSHLRLVRPPEHLDAVNHFNFAVRQSRAPWFSVVCADDVPLPNFVRTLTRGIRRGKNAVIVKAGFHYVDDNLTTFRTTYLARQPRWDRWPHNFISQLSGPKGSLAAMAVSRKAFDAVGGFDPKVGLASDWQMQLDLAPLGAFTRLHRPISRYRSSHHPDLDIARLPRYLMDFAYMFTEAIPKIAEQNGIDVVTNNRLREAATSVFLPRLQLARKHLSPELFAASADAIRPALEGLRIETLIDSA